jgi:hypothetical protein
MSKPDPSITADLLSKLPSTKPGAPKATGAGKHDHSALRGPQPGSAKVSSRSAEKSSTAGRTRTSNRGK